MLASSEGVLWSSFQTTGRRPNALDIKRLAGTLRSIDAAGRTFVVEGPIEAWPEQSHIPQRVLQRLTTISTCGMAPPGQLPCVKYLVASNSNIPEVKCNCDNSGNTAITDNGINECNVSSIANEAITTFLLQTLKLQEKQKAALKSIPHKVTQQGVTGNWPVLGRPAEGPLTVDSGPMVAESNVEARRGPTGGVLREHKSSLVTQGGVTDWLSNGPIAEGASNAQDPRKRPTGGVARDPKPSLEKTHERSPLMRPRPEKTHERSPLSCSASRPKGTEVPRSNGMKMNETNEPNRKLKRPTSSTQAALAYPTSMAIRQKAAKEAVKKQLMDDGKTKDEIKQILKKKKQHQELIFDDCGSDTTAINDTKEHALLQTSYDIDDHREACFDEAMYDEQSSDDEMICQTCGNDNWKLQLEDELRTVFNEDGEAFELGGLLGSESEASAFFEGVSRNGKFVALSELHSHFVNMEQNSNRKLDLLEVFGGEAGVSRIAIRKRLQTGKNIDVVTGTDLTDPAEARKLLKFLDDWRPEVIILGPPCTAFSAWSKCNRSRNAATYRASRIIGEKLAELTAEICMRQLEKSQHFIVEQPAHSDMYQLPCFVHLWKTRKVGSITFPQCPMGLRVDDEPIYKLTELWASNPELLKPFEGLECTCSSHGELQGSRKTQLAATYPLDMCRRLISGVEKLLRKNLKSELAYPTVRTLDNRGFIYDCPACKAHKNKKNASHTRRTEPPGVCKYPYETSASEPTRPPTDNGVFSCPACNGGKSDDHPDHTRTENCRAPTTTTAGVRRGGGSEPRDAAQRAHGDESASRAQTPNNHDFDAEVGVTTLGAASSSRPAIAREERELESAPLPPLLSGPATDADYSAATAAEAAAAAAPASDAESEEDENAEDAAEQGVIASLRPRTARERRLADKLAKQVDSEAQATTGGVEDHRSFDVSKALTALRSTDPKIRKQALQRLHLRWWHATITEMRRTLSVANVPHIALADIPSVVQACKVCRSWQTPPHKTTTTVRLVLNFNDENQCDLVFIRSKMQPARGLLPIMHCIDVCTRFGLTCITGTESDGKNEVKLCDAISKTWIAIFGAMQVLVVDGESGLSGRYAMDWASTNSISIKIKAPRQKAWIIERHNAPLRSGIHMTEGQLISEGIHVNFEVIVATVTFALNALTVINGSTPYNAVLGRQPQLLPPLEGGYLNEADGSLNRPGSEHRYTARVREVAAQNMIEYVAKQRIERANRGKTQAPLELQAYEPGQQVDVWYDPSTKDTQGWRGPASVTSVNLDNSNVSVRYQSRTLDRRPQEVRPHIAYLIFSVWAVFEYAKMFKFLQERIESLPADYIQTFGLIWSTGMKNTPPGWTTTKHTNTQWGKVIYSAALRLATSQAGLTGVVTTRIARGVKKLNALQGFVASELWMWIPEVNTDVHHVTYPTIFESASEDLLKPIDVHKLAKELDEVQRGDAHLGEICLIQFLMIGEDDAKQQAITHCDIPLVQGLGLSMPNGRPPGAETVTNRNPVLAPEQRPFQPVIVNPIPPPPPPPPSGSSAAIQAIQPIAWPKHLPPPDLLPPPPAGHGGGDQLAMNIAASSGSSGLGDLVKRQLADIVRSDNPPPPAPPPSGVPKALPSPPPLRALPAPPPAPPPPSLRDDWMQGQGGDDAPPPPPPAAGAVRIVRESPRSRSPHLHNDNDESMPGATFNIPLLPPAIGYELPPIDENLPMIGGVNDPQTISPMQFEENPGDGRPPRSRTRSNRRAPFDQTERDEATINAGIAKFNSPALATPRRNLAKAFSDVASPASTVQYPSPAASAASTVQYPSPESQPLLPLALKRDRLTPGEQIQNQKRSKDEDHEEDEPPNEPGQSSNEPILPIQGGINSSSAVAEGIVGISPTAKRAKKDKKDEDDDDDDDDYQDCEEEDYHVFVSWRDEMQQALRNEESSMHYPIAEEEQNGEDLEKIRTFLSTVPPALLGTIVIEGDLAKWHELGHLLQEGEVIEHTFVADEAESTTTQIVKKFDILTKEELQLHKKDLNKSKAKELLDLHTLGCFKRKPKRLARNLIDVRWVNKWKLKDNVRAITTRMTMRGFRDNVSSLETYAGTASRGDQRIVDSVIINEPDFINFSFDVSKAFAKGMTFKEISELTGEPLRAVEFYLSEEDCQLLRLIPGYEDFNSETECLSNEKPIYGLKDAPRAWRVKLDIVLRSWKGGGSPGQLLPALTSPEIYMAHFQDDRHHMINMTSNSVAILDQAKLSDERQSEGSLSEKSLQTDESLKKKLSNTTKRKLKMILSTHVDDLKGGATKVIADSLLRHLNETVGDCKAEWHKFTHLGVEHEHSEKGHSQGQAAYILTLRPIDPNLLKGKPDDESAGPELTAKFMSLLGGVAWTVLTATGALVYIQALQRHAQKPTIGHCKRINIVLRYLRRNESGLSYSKLTHPLKLVAFTDAAFRALPEESSGLALRGLAVLLVEASEGKLCGANGKCHLLDVLTRRIRRVVRSTFSAELNALVDALEGVLLLQVLLHQVFCGTDETAAEVCLRIEAGALYPPLDVAVDAMSVYEAIVAADCCEPAEASLKVHLLSVRERLMQGIIQKLHWCDTRDMLADGLTKGGVARDLLHAAAKGHYVNRQPTKSKKTAQFGKYDPIKRDRNSPFAHPAPIPWEELASAEQLRVLIQALYVQYHPEKLRELQNIFEKYSGRELKLLRALRQKYDPYLEASSRKRKCIGSHWCEEHENDFMQRNGVEFQNKNFENKVNVEEESKKSNVKEFIGKEVNLEMSVEKEAASEKRKSEKESKSTNVKMEVEVTAFSPPWRRISSSSGSSPGSGNEPPWKSNKVEASGKRLNPKRRRKS